MDSLEKLVTRHKTKTNKANTQHNIGHPHAQNEDRKKSIICVGHLLAQDEDKLSKKKKTPPKTTICDGHHYAQTNTNNVNEAHSINDKEQRLVGSGSG